MRLMEQVAIMSDSDAACVVCVSAASSAPPVPTGWMQREVHAETMRWMAKGHRRPLPPVRLCKQL